MLPNRESGNWLPQVESCPVRAKPCGNPLDADQAMRAGQIQAAGRGDLLSNQSSEQALKNARSIANKCGVPSGQCPLEKHFSCDRMSALDVLRTSVQ